MNDFSDLSERPLRQLTGSRIRERRLALGVKQAELSRRVGMSPSYLNLIEHNRRRIAGKLLGDIAAALDTDPKALSEGAHQGVLTTLNAAAAEAKVAVDPATTEEFVGRYSTWAEVIAAQQRQIEDLQGTVTSLSDRMAHDPYLSTALHEMLSSVTSIRSSASILAGDEPVEPVWAERFHKNIFADAIRLGDAAQQLVQYLDAPQNSAASDQSPMDEAEAFIAAQGDGDARAVAAFEGSRAAQAILYRYQEQRARDERSLPDSVLNALQLDMAAFDPLVAAEELGVPLDVLMRRMLELSGWRDVLGLVECDASGTVTFRKGIEGFPLPRYGDACAQWPLFDALTQPGMPHRAVLRSLGAKGEVFAAFAIATPLQARGYGQVPQIRATMLLLRSPDLVPDLDVGMSCRVCPKEICPARREPSILAHSD